MKRRIVVAILVIGLLLGLAAVASGDPQPLSIQAAYQQANPQAGGQLDLDWSVSGGTAPYTVQVAWKVQESCLQKVMKTESFTTSSGTSSYTLPNTSIDQACAIVTVTDDTGATQTWNDWIWLENWRHVDDASFSVYNDQDHVEVGDPISGSWNINPGKYTISNVRYRWVTVYRDSQGMQQEMTSTWTTVGNSLTGNSTAYTTTQTGMAYLEVAFDANDGWTCPGGRFDPIQVLDSGVAPLVPEITLTTNKAEPGEPITIAWNVTGAGNNHYIWIEWTYNSDSGNLFHDVRDHAATSGSVTYTPTEKGQLSAWVHATNYDTGVQINKNAYLIVGNQPGPGPGSNIMIQANYTQTSLPIGKQLALDWSVSGGTAPYSVEVKWLAMESCLQKVMKTETFTTASGTASFTLPSNTIDQVEATITVTDGTGETQYRPFWTEVEGWNHGQNIVASDDIENGQDYAYVGDTISGSWSIDPGKYTISNVRYRWLVVTKGDNGPKWEYGDWFSTGDNLTGTATLKTTKAGNTYLNLAFDANDGWSEPGVIFDPIQVLNAGEVPLTAEITISPEMPKTGENITLAWNVGGATATTDIEVEWEYSPYDGSSSSDTISSVSSGTRTLNFSSAGQLTARVYVEDEDKDLRFSRWARVDVAEPSGLILTVSPANPQLDQEVTISWEITRESYDDAGIDIVLMTGNLTKYASGIKNAEKIRTQKTGSATFTPKEGDSFIVTGYIWANGYYFEEELEPIPLTGSWNAPSPLNVNVTYTIQQPRSVAGPRIIANYTITGGTGNISSVTGYWYRYNADGSIMHLHRRTLGDDASGQVVYTPTQNGDYALALQVGDYESGWWYHPSPLTVTNKATITNAVQTALGIEFFEELPEMVDLDGDYQFGWDVIGGDSSDERTTQVYMATDDGMVLQDYNDWGFTSYCQIPIGEIGPDSQYVIIELTPSDMRTTGDTVRFEIPINRGGRLILPRDLKRIEDEAFLNVAATEIDIPDGVTEIGENAFPSGVTLILGSESEWWEWAEMNGYNPVFREE